MRLGLISILLILVVPLIASDLLTAPYPLGELLVDGQSVKDLLVEPEDLVRRYGLLFGEGRTDPGWFTEAGYRSGRLDLYSRVTHRTRLLQEDGEVRIGNQRFRMSHYNWPHKPAGSLYEVKNLLDTKRLLASQFLRYWDSPVFLTHAQRVVFGNDRINLMTGLEGSWYRQDDDFGESWNRSLAGIARVYGRYSGVALGAGVYRGETTAPWAGFTLDRELSWNLKVLYSTRRDALPIETLYQDDRFFWRSAFPDTRDDLRPVERTALSASSEFFCGEIAARIAGEWSHGSRRFLPSWSGETCSWVRSRDNFTLWSGSADLSWNGLHGEATFMAGDRIDFDPRFRGGLEGRVRLLPFTEARGGIESSLWMKLRDDVVQRTTLKASLNYQGFPNTVIVVRGWAPMSNWHDTALDNGFGVAVNLIYGKEWYDPGLD